jgi:transcriptional antiterminator RfaH
MKINSQLSNNCSPLDAKKWLVIRTKPQRERIVHGQLKSWYNMEGWCPVKKIRRQYSDRVKEVEVILFKNYVFVQVENYKEQIQVLKLDGVLGYIMNEKSPAVVYHEEMLALKEFIKSYENISVVSLEIGKQVILINGIWEGSQGIIRDIGRNKVTLELPTLGFILEAPIEMIAQAV